MLGSNLFYHSTTRKYVIMFGNLFNDIVIRRFDANNNTIQQIPVPINYSPKQKWFNLLAKHPADPEQGSVANQLPRLGFEITGISRDTKRKINGINKLVDVVDDRNKLISQFAPIPYKIQFELYSLSKNMDDALQITEQILPYFNPDFTSTLNLIPGLQYKYDVRLNMGDPTFQDVFDNDFKERRAIIWTFPFEADGWFYGPVQTQGVIKRVQVDIAALPGTGAIKVEEASKASRNVRIVVTPGLTADGQPTTNPALTIPYKDIDKDDDYGFIEQISTYFDGKHYNPVKGIDE